ncbi:purine-nucleoside phosphorylase [Anaerorhabdus sp.]|jgi:purine-nucleoside phosphorylase|uniref:purine-nucleoside phosphorylase n=1 Tax=Anaerorhabdus sp. TaxID=1872524 RepID=UPI002FC717DD
MSTPHNAAEKGQIAKTVLMPGDPLRAKFIAETFLENPKQFNAVRNMFGYTGTYKGKEISVMGSGMGMPSIGIYSYELYTQYGVENIIRIGSAGAYTADLKVFDVVLADSAYSESSYAFVQSGYKEDKTYPSKELNDKIKLASTMVGIPLTESCIHSSDVFYREGGLGYVDVLINEKKCKAVEMESFALFHNANVLGKNAACLITISDSFVSSEVTTAEERQNSFTNMMKIALEAAIM